MTQDRITLVRPDDWHLHLRDGAMLTRTVPDAARIFGRAIIMPNLSEPVRTTAQAADYRQRILAHLAAGASFQPLMTLYLTDQTSVNDIEQAKLSGIVYAAKLYPAGATTNSSSGVTSLDAIYPVLEAMEKYQLPLLLHGEITHADIDIFDREKYFIDQKLMPLVKNFPALKIVMEHITTKEAVEFVSQSPENIAATLTVQHLMYNRNHMLVGGIRPHFYCLPILKRNIHQQALVNAAISGNPKFFLGTDSAPHPQHAKESACGCAGCYTAYAAIELYAEIFEQHQALDKLEGFASYFGANFYDLPQNTDKITLTRNNWTAPSSLTFGEHQLIPLRAGETLRWQMLYENTNE